MNKDKKGLSPGRIIRQDASKSVRIASLSVAARGLFFMLIPHFDDTGKMNGGAGFIKDTVVPLIKDYTYENLPELLDEISAKTNVKREEKDGGWELHAIKFGYHQGGGKEKLGGGAPYGEFKNVFLAEIEIEKLNQKFPGDVPSRIESLSIYMAKTGKAYKSHYAALLTWGRMDNRKNLLPFTPSQTPAEKYLQRKKDESKTIDVEAV